MATKKKNKIANKKKDSQGVKTKKFKKLGLAKYIDSNKRPRKKKENAKDEAASEVNKKSSMDYQQQNPKIRVVDSLKKQQKNLSLVDRCKQQMSSSLLRLVDEKLYTSHSSNIPLTKDEFISYHDAYSSVCKKWPTKPIDFIVRFIKKRIFAKKAVSKIKFADIGCGREPLLKMKLPEKAHVQSFDLVSTHEDIIEANMDSLPLDENSINCAVYSLSLMAKDIGPILLEAKRILRIGGSLLIVEVTSRFEGRERKFVERLEKIGFKKQSITQLKPNGYFTFFHFTKIDNLKTSIGFKLELKPCTYKSR